MPAPAEWFAAYAIVTRGERRYLAALRASSGRVDRSPRAFFCAQRVCAVGAQRCRQSALERVTGILLKLQVPFERGGAARIGRCRNQAGALMRQLPVRLLRDG